ncbi:hypothetical protein UCDDS831_g04013 [Diplodia seriata]|uniref:Uncharacterized protein n=1 Tax=Diplodia seriata TaxID=420778 RepID=A0A0G2GDN5_9PEZI|nr:hypothetical protein UCDDS831_g04013 [Diplodia seriata]
MSSKTNFVLNMPFQEKKALAESKVRLTLKWTDKHTSNVMTVNDVPKPMFMAFSPVAKASLSLRGSNKPQNLEARAVANVYDLGEVADLAPAAVSYVLSALAAACRSTEAGAMPEAFPEPANVEKHLKCFVAAKKLGLARYIEHAWRGACMDAVSRAGHVTFKEFVYLFTAFGEKEEPTLLKHVLNNVVYAEMTGQEDHPDVVSINRFVYGSHPALALLKKAIETDVQKKLTTRKDMEEKRAQKEKERRAFLERKQKREMAEKKRQDRFEEKQRKLEQARNGERVLDDEEVRGMTYSGPLMATISNKLR